MNACERFTLPVPVFLKRFAAPLWVLSLGITSSIDCSGSPKSRFWTQGLERKSPAVALLGRNISIWDFNDLRQQRSRTELSFVASAASSARRVAPVRPAVRRLVPEAWPFSQALSSLAPESRVEYCPPFADETRRSPSP